MTNQAAPDAPPEQSDSPAEEVFPGPHASQHASLKYSLLGPSLTKAGQDSVDQKKVFLSISADL